MISYEDFSKLEIKIGTILEAQKVEDADKLMRLLVDLGEEKRQVIAGIALSYQADELIGKQLPIITNLEARQIRGLESQGMILASSTQEGLALLHPDKLVPPGSKVS